MDDNNSRASEKLQEIFDLWSGLSEEEDDFYKWPFTVKEIKRSEEILAEIEKIPLDDPELKERFEEMKKLVGNAHKYVPDFKKLLIKASVMLGAVIVILTVFFMRGDFKTIPFEYDENDWIMAEETPLYFSPFEADSIVARGGIILRPGDRVKPVSRTARYFIQIETENGDRGYIHFSRVSGAKTGVLNFDAELFSSIEQETSTDSVRAGEKVRIINYHVEGNDTRRRGMGGLMLKSRFTEIETEDGRRGLIYSTTPTPYNVAEFQIYYGFYGKIPSTGRIYRFPAEYEAFAERITGRELEDIEKIYGPAGAVLHYEGAKEAHFRHIGILTKEQKYQGVFVKFGPDGKAVSFETDLERGRSFPDKLPFAQLLRKAPLYNPVKSAFYYAPVQKGSFELKFEEWTQTNFFVKILLWGLYYLIALFTSFLFLSIPRFILHPFILLSDHCPKLDKEGSIFTDQIMLIIGYYFFILWLSISGYQFGWAAIFRSGTLASFFDNASNGFWTYLAVCTLPFGYWIARARKNITYNKCSACRAMDLTSNKGSAYLGESKEVSWGTWDKFKGKSESSDTITYYYERRAKKTTEFFDDYKDLRYCNRCGNKWGIKRRVKKGERVEKL